MLNKVLGAEYKALNSDVEYSAEYRYGEPNMEPYIRIYSIVLKIDFESRINSSTFGS